jgi:hypothetical protein
MGGGGVSRWLDGSERTAVVLLGVGEKVEKGRKLQGPRAFIAGRQREGGGRPAHQRPQDSPTGTQCVS